MGTNGWIMAIICQPVPSDILHPIFFAFWNQHSCPHFKTDLISQNRGLVVHLLVSLANFYTERFKIILCFKRWYSAFSWQLVALIDITLKYDKAVQIAWTLQTSRRSCLLTCAKTSMPCNVMCLFQFKDKCYITQILSIVYFFFVSVYDMIPCPSWWLRLVKFLKVKDF